MVHRLHLPRIADHCFPCQHSRFREIIGLRRDEESPTNSEVHKTSFIEPMQCRAVTTPPVDGKWTFEIKFDGYRCIAVKRGREVTLFSRNQKVLSSRFPVIVDVLASLAGDFVFDGELVALDPQGRPSFQLLQGSFSHSLQIYFYAFLLNRNGDLLVNLPFSSVTRT